MTFKRILTTRDHLFEKENWKDQVFTEYCGYLLEALFSPFLGQSKETMLLERPVLERIKTRVKELIVTAITDKALLEFLTGASQYSEAPFVSNDNGYTLRGRIDKLFKDRTSDEWAIIDWKTG